MRSGRMVFEFLVLVALSTNFFLPANAIKCYQCSSTTNGHPFQCNEYLSSDIDMEPTSCDAIHGAKYCVKKVGRHEALGLNCYQCTSAEEWKCTDGDLVTSSLEAKNCDHVFEAQYCLKTSGTYGDGIGTKRMCSSVNYGSVCNYVKNPGDVMDYRTCVYTCQGDGCNPASSLKPSIKMTIFAIFFFVLLSSKS